MKNFYILIGVDCDPDRKRFNNVIPNNELTIHGFINFYKSFEKIRTSLVDKTNIAPILTLNIRADYQIEKCYNDIEYCYKLFFEKINFENEFNKYDEIAWHHHHFRLMDGKWITEFRDEKWHIEHVFYTYDKIKKYNIHTVHTGELIMNNSLMNAYNDVGIKVDYSAVPGINNMSGTYNPYDYSEIKSIRPFIPARNNYQQHDQNNENNIIEIPTNTTSTNFLNFVSKTNYLIRSGKFPNNNLPIKSFIPINAHPFLFKMFLKSLMKTDASNNYFISYIHADEMLPDYLKNIEAKLIFKTNYFEKNLLYLINFIKQKGANPIFINFKNYYTKIKNEHINTDSKK